MRHTSKVTFVLVALAVAFAVPAVAEQAALPVPAADQTVSSSLPQAAPAASCCAQSAAARAGVPTPEWLSDVSEASCCRPRCSSNSQCTAFCGGPGQCIQVNSCCRDCACFQL